MNRLTILATAALLSVAGSLSIARAADNPAPVLPIVGDEAESLPILVAPGDEHIRYTGRFQIGQGGPNAPRRCSWSSSAVTLAFAADQLNVRLNESGGSDEYEIVVDGRPAGVLVPKAGSHRYRVFPVGNGAAERFGRHTITLFKRTEAFFGIGSFEGFDLPSEGRVLAPPPAPAHRIEIVGDSITCGYGNEAPNQTAKFTSQTENAYLAYGAVAARRVDADIVTIAWSGRKMYPDNTMDEVYGYSLPTDKSSVWDFSGEIPDVVVINLGTNDLHAKTPAPDDDWVRGYEAFIARLRTHYPKAAIYCATSPMLSGDKDARERKDLHRIVEEENAKGDHEIRFLDFATQDVPRDGAGAGWHPSLKTDRIMAAKLAETLHADLGWKLSDDPAG